MHAAVAAARRQLGRPRTLEPTAPVDTVDDRVVRLDDHRLLVRVRARAEAGAGDGARARAGVRARARARFGLTLSRSRSQIARVPTKSPVAIRRSASVVAPKVPHLNDLGRSTSASSSMLPPLSW